VCLLTPDGMKVYNYEGASVAWMPVQLPACAGINLYSLVNEAHVCEQLAQSCYVKRSGRDLNLRPLDCGSDTLTTTPPATLITYHYHYIYYTTLQQESLPLISNACDRLNLDSMPSTLVRKNDNGCDCSMTDAVASGLVQQLADVEESVSDDELVLFVLLLLVLLASVRGLFDGEASLSPIFTGLSPVVQHSSYMQWNYNYNCYWNCIYYT